MNIKEVAQALELKMQDPDDGRFDIGEFAEALISPYKAELLKEVGEPIAYYDPDLDCGSAGISFDPLSDGICLYTSDQVAAAILKATKPLEEEIDRLESESEEYAQLQSRCFDGGGSHASVFDEVSELRAQLAAAQEENVRLENQVLARDAELWGRTQEILGLKDQLAKAEQRVAEWQPISTAPITCNSLLIRRNGEVCIANWGDYDEVNQPKFTHWMPLPKAPANCASS